MKDTIVIVILILILLSYIVTFFVCCGQECKKYQEYQEWYNSLTGEEKQEEYEKKVVRYEVVLVSRYVKTNTNNFGGVTSTDICYSFSYTDNSGNLHHRDDFTHLAYGLTKVAIGETNQYIVDNNTLDPTYTLQLTKDTLKNLE